MLLALPQIRMGEAVQGAFTPPVPTLTAAQMTGLPPLSPEYPFESTPALDIPTSQEIVADATTDTAALDRIVGYFDAHEDALRLAFEEDDPVRLKVLYAMYVVHISTVYGEADPPTSLIAFLDSPYSHCGFYTRFQSEILDAFGISWRIMYHATAEHAWVEVPINGNWELFDPTTNVWADRDGVALLAGEPRHYRAFYTPLNDVNRPDAREHYFRGPAANPRVGWYNMPRLREWMIRLGLTYTPRTDEGDYFVWASAPGQGSDRNQPWFDGLN
ncbi:MAG: hypothetical protein U0521_04120 [Anaerolineae bacterium]